MSLFEGSIFSISIPKDNSFILILGFLIISLIIGYFYKEVLEGCFLFGRKSKLNHHLIRNYMIKGVPTTIISTFVLYNISWTNNLLGKSYIYFGSLAKNLLNIFSFSGDRPEIIQLFLFGFLFLICNIIIATLINVILFILKAIKDLFI